MSETNETEGKAARGARKMSLNLRRTVESGHVRVIKRGVKADRLTPASLV